MAQEAIQELDMDVFARRIGPYFSWLESKIESGWEQSDRVPKSVLKEVKYLATTMRARFILGVTRADFTKEVQRTLELFELSLEAFSMEADEIETKQKHFIKGISEELGAEFIPADYRIEQPKVQQPEPIPGPEPMPGPEPIPEPDTPMEETAKISRPKTTKAKITKPKAEKTEKIKTEQAEKPKIKKTEAVAEQAKETKTARPKTTTKQKPRKKSAIKFSPVKWLKNLIYGEE